MPEYGNPEAGWELETDAQEPIQVDAGYDDDCCNEIRQIMIQSNEGAYYDIDKERIWRDERGAWQSSTRFDGKTYAVPKDAMTVREWLENVDCEDLLSQVGESEAEQGKTLNDVYNECVNNKTPQGGDFTMGEPIDLAWRMLKHG